MGNGPSSSSDPYSGISHILPTRQFKCAIAGVLGSGKTTIFKQLNRNFIKSNTNYRQVYVKPIHRHILYGIDHVLYRMEELGIPLATPALQASAQCIHDADDKTLISTSLAQHIKLIWNDMQFQQVLHMRNKDPSVNPFADTLDNFMYKLDHILSPQYVPTMDDILACRWMDNAVNASIYYHNNASMFKLYDLPGLQEARADLLVDFHNHMLPSRIREITKLVSIETNNYNSYNYANELPYTSDTHPVDILFYVVSLSHFNRVTFEDPNAYELHESIRYFASLLNNPASNSFITAETQIVFIFTGSDLFPTKVLQATNIEDVINTIPVELLFPDPQSTTFFPLSRQEDRLTYEKSFMNSSFSLLSASSAVGGHGGHGHAGHGSTTASVAAGSHLQGYRHAHEHDQEHHEDGRHGGRLTVSSSSSAFTMPSHAKGLRTPPPPKRPPGGHSSSQFNQPLSATPQAPRSAHHHRHHHHQQPTTTTTGGALTAAPSSFSSAAEFDHMGHIPGQHVYQLHQQQQQQQQQHVHHPSSTLGSSSSPTAASAAAPSAGPPPTHHPHATPARSEPVLPPAQPASAPPPPLSHFNASKPSHPQQLAQPQQPHITGLKSPPPPPPSNRIQPSQQQQVSDAHSTHPPSSPHHLQPPPGRSPPQYSPYPRKSLAPPAFTGPQTALHTTAATPSLPPPPPMASVKSMPPERNAVRRPPHHYHGSGGSGIPPSSSFVSSTTGAAPPPPPHLLASPASPRQHLAAPPPPLPKSASSASLLSTGSTLPIPPRKGPPPPLPPPPVPPPLPDALPPTSSSQPPQASSPPASVVSLPPPLPPAAAATAAPPPLRVPVPPSAASRPPSSVASSASHTKPSVIPAKIHMLYDGDDDDDDDDEQQINAAKASHFSSSSAMSHFTSPAPAPALGMHAEGDILMNGGASSVYGGSTAAFPHSLSQFHRQLSTGSLPPAATSFSWKYTTPMIDTTSGPQPDHLQVRRDIFDLHVRALRDTSRVINHYAVNALDWDSLRPVIEFEFQRCVDRNTLTRG